MTRVASGRPVEIDDFLEAEFAENGKCSQFREWWHEREPASQHFVDWLTAYGQAWEAGDPDAVVKLFTVDGTYHEMPFDEPMFGADAIRQYWTEGAKDSQESIKFSFVPVAETETTGFARWSASFVRVPGGQRVEIEGFLEAEFARPGVCSYFREWWHVREV